MSHPMIDGARGLTWRTTNSGPVAYWQARSDLAKRGFRPRVRRLWPPTAAPHPGTVDAVTADYIRTQCNILQDEMLEWANGGKRAGRAVYNGTLGSLIEVYRTDPDSDYHGLRHSSRSVYNSHLDFLAGAVGKRALASLTVRDFKSWYRAWDDGHPARAHGRMSQLRIVLTFGIAFEHDQLECQRLSGILGAQRFPRGRARRTILTAAQVTAFRAMAHELGRPSLALAEALRFELCLRRNDTYGAWVPEGEPGESEIHCRGSKWLYGITWREVSPGLILTHRISKSLRGRDAILDPEAGHTKTFDLKLYPMVMDELARIPRGISGPLIVEERTGLPYGNDVHRTWRLVANACGIPADVQLRDARAGGITEAEEATGDRQMAQKAAGHSQIETTGIYVRDENRATAQVAVARAKHRSE